MQFLHKKIASAKHDEGKTKNVGRAAWRTRPARTAADPGTAGPGTTAYALRHRDLRLRARCDETALQLAPEEHRSEST